MAILSDVRRSTSGLAPVLRATMRFWIRVESLNRPPTLFTMPSSFSSSSMIALRKMVADDSGHVADGRVQVVVHHLVGVLAGPPQFVPRGLQPALDHGLAVGPAVA